MSFTDDELRLIGVSGGIWLRMLEAREKRLLNKICGQVRQGTRAAELDLELAELVSLRDQAHEIRTAMQQNN